MIPGLGVRLAETWLPEPDVLVRSRNIRHGNSCHDIIVAFGVLSRSTADQDLHWKRRAYADLQSLMHVLVGTIGAKARKFL